MEDWKKYLWAILKYTYDGKVFVEEIDVYRRLRGTENTPDTVKYPEVFITSMDPPVNDDLVFCFFRLLSPWKT